MHRRNALPCLVAVLWVSFSGIGHAEDRKQALGGDLSPEAVSREMVRLRSITGVPFEMTASEHFAIYHKAGAEDIAPMVQVVEAARTHFYEVFTDAGFTLSRLQGPLVWICFPGQGGFNEYALLAEGVDLSRLDGYYSTRTNRVAVVQTPPTFYERGIPTLRDGSRILLASHRPSDRVLPMSPRERDLDSAKLTHELAHQLAFNSGLHKRGVMYPVRVSEGLATNCEFDWSEEAGFASCSGVRSACLLKARAEGELMSLRKFVVQTNIPRSSRRSRQCYAQAWAFFRYVLTEHPDSLHRYLATLAALPQGRRSTATLLREFTDAFGPPEKLEASWERFIARQELQVIAH